MQIVHTKGDYMRLTIKARGTFLLERVGTFVIPTSVDMLLSLLGTIQTLSAAKSISLAARGVGTSSVSPSQRGFSSSSVEMARCLHQSKFI
ncbi:hypothetical protein EDD21DRAFT_415348 [Dissophora ornata]|nr:hypothetical protein EDD21DRAFT_415348 [Dissophora ornata]